MQLVGLLILIAILVLLLGAGIYFARGQKSRGEHYGSWSRVLAPQFRGSAMDVQEQLNKEISAGGARPTPPILALPQILPSQAF